MMARICTWFPGLLQLLLIGLKLGQVISWSWWVVLTPLWMVLGATLIWVAYCFVAVLVDDWRRRRRNAAEQTRRAVRRYPS